MKKSALAIIENPQRHILLQQRDGTMSLTAYRWGLFGGAVLEGQVPQEVILSKLEDEIGFKQEHIVQADQQPILINNLPEGEEQWVFLIKTNVLDPKVFSLHEGLAMRFFSEEEIFALGLDFAFNTKDIVVKYLHTR